MSNLKVYPVSYSFMGMTNNGYQEFVSDQEYYESKQEEYEEIQENFNRCYLQAMEILRNGTEKSN